MNTKTKILKAGIRLWKKNPDEVKALTIAKEIKMVHATVLYHFPEGVKDAVAAYAVETGESQIISQLVLMGHPAAKLLTPEQRQEHFSRSML